MFVLALVLVICTQRSFMTSSAVRLLMSRSEYKISAALTLILAVRLAGTTISWISSDTVVVSVVTILKNSELLASSMPFRSSGLKLEPALYALRSSFAFIPPEVMSTSRSITPRPSRALRRPVSLPLAAISDSPETNFMLSMLISLLLKPRLNPFMIFLRGKYGVMTIPVRTSMLPLRSHSL